jgi:hypothetical protein
MKTAKDRQGGDTCWPFAVRDGIVKSRQYNVAVR